MPGRHRGRPAAQFQVDRGVRATRLRPPDRTRRCARSSARPIPRPTSSSARLGDPAVVEPAPRRLDPAAVTWSVSLGLPSAKPEALARRRAKRARTRLGPGQLLIVSVVGTPAPGGDGEQLARRLRAGRALGRRSGRRRASRSILSCPDTPPSSRRWSSRTRRCRRTSSRRVRRAVGARPVVAKLGALAEPPRAARPGHRPRALGGRLRARQRTCSAASSKPTARSALPGEGRELAGVSGAAVWDPCRVQVRRAVRVAKSRSVEQGHPRRGRHHHRRARARGALGGSPGIAGSDGRPRRPAPRRALQELGRHAETRPLPRRVQMRGGARRPRARRTLYVRADPSRPARWLSLSLSRSLTMRSSSELAARFTLSCRAHSTML